MNHSLISKIAIALLFTSLISSCSTGVSINPVQFFKGQHITSACNELKDLTEQDAQRSLNKDIYQLQQNVERNLVFREKINKQLDKLNTITQQGAPLSPKLMDQLSQTIKHEIDLIRPILATTVKHACWIKDDNLQANKLALKGKMIILATLVKLYDEYGTFFAVINENDRLRRFINHADSGYERNENSLESLTHLFVDTDMLSYASELVFQYHKHHQAINQLASEDLNLTYLIQMIEQSKSYPVLLTMDYFDAANHRRKIRRKVTQDTLEEIGRSIMNGLSEGFSNAVGNYEERKGLLYNNKEVEHSIQKQLKLGDILLEKTPFRLTDSMIPGFWGHAAIWVGSETELKQLGLWQHPLVIKYHQQIKQGEVIAESLRTGTTLSPLSHFLNIDDLAILRLKNSLTNEQMKETILLTLRQIGKAYDFNFDVETTDKIVCSQLVYLAYTTIDWPTESTLGRFTISPDNIAIKALHDGPFDIVLLYHNGKKINEDKLKTMQKLMEP